MTAASRDFILAALAMFVTAFLGLVLPGKVFASGVVVIIILGALGFGLALIWPPVRR